MISIRPEVLFLYDGEDSEQDPSNNDVLWDDLDAEVGIEAYMMPSCSERYFAIRHRKWPWTSNKLCNPNLNHFTHSWASPHTKVQSSDSYEWVTKISKGHRWEMSVYLLVGVPPHHMLWNSWRWDNSETLNFTIRTTCWTQHIPVQNITQQFLTHLYPKYNMCT